MAINLEKMRAKLDALKNKGSREDNVFWRPEDGKQDIRIVTPEDGDPFKEYHFHYNVAKGGFLCPKRNFGDACPVCDFASELWRDSASSGDEEGKKMAKNLFVRQRFFAPVLVRGLESKGIRVWGFGKKAYEQLLGLVLNPEYGDITDVEEGTDLTLTYGKPEGASFPQTTLIPRRRTSPLCDDMIGGVDECAKLLDSIPEFDGIFERLSPKQVSNLLEEYLNPDDHSKENVIKYDQTDSATSVDKAIQELVAG
jgi:hypothetical protein